MFLTALEQRFLCSSTRCSAQSARQWTRLLEIFSHASKTAQILHWGSFSLCVSVSTSRHLESHFSKPSSPSSRVGSAPVIRAHNRRALEPVLRHPVAFLAYLEDKGSRFSWCCPKKPVFELIASLGNNRSNQCIPPYGMSKKIRLECPHSLPAFGMVYEVKAIFSQSTSLEPRKTLNWDSLFYAVPSTLSNIQEWVRPVEDVSLMSRIAWNPKLGQFISQSLSILSPPNGMIIVKIH